MALWPETNTEWVVLTPAGYYYSEELSNYVRVTKLTGHETYRDDVEITTFSFPLDIVELQMWIRRGRTEGRRAHSTRGLTLHGPEPVAAVDGWTGEPAALPAETAMRRLGLCFFGKAAGVLPVASEPEPVLPVAQDKGGADSPVDSAAGAAWKKPKPDRIGCRSFLRPCSRPCLGVCRSLSL